MKILKSIAAAAVLTFSAVPALAVSSGVYMEYSMYAEGDWSQSTVVGQIIYYCDGTVWHWGELTSNQAITGGGDC